MFPLCKRSSVCGINPANPNPRLAAFLDSIATLMPATVLLAERTALDCRGSQFLEVFLFQMVGKQTNKTMVLYPLI
ncbi:unnamed protein product, partial [Vitis vinifera]